MKTVKFTALLVGGGYFRFDLEVEEGTHDHAALAQAHSLIEEDRVPIYGELPNDGYVVTILNPDKIAGLFLKV